MSGNVMENEDEDMEKEDEVNEYLQTVFSNQSVMNNCVTESKFDLVKFWSNDTS